MKLLGISGSARRASTNTALLEAMIVTAPRNIELTFSDPISDLPIFSPDLEGANTPSIVLNFIEQVDLADGLIISSPEYVHAIPGGLKNAIDWLVSRHEIIGKPVVLVHASHRGKDMLRSLRLVLQTVTDGFNNELFLRFSLMSKTPSEVAEFLLNHTQSQKIQSFMSEYRDFIINRDLKNKT